MKRFLLSTFWLLFLLSCSPKYDLIIRNSLIYDGTGSAPFKGEIGIRGDKIVTIKKKIRAVARQEIDAHGMAVSPGFIDLHAHLEPLALYPDAQSHVMQGVTTALGGPDGGSPLLLNRYLDSLALHGVGMNVGYLIGHNTVRNHVMGMVDRDPTSEELTVMQKYISEALEQGAYGMSTGLKYLPGTFAETAEIVALAKVVSKRGGIYTSHLREEGLGLLEGVEEAITIAREAQIPVILTHHKVIGEPMWGASKQTLQMVDQARASGLNILMDQYPYTASHTGLSVVIPSWALEGNPYTKFSKRCQDPTLRDSIKQGIIFNLINDRGGNDLRRIQFAKFDWKPELTGKTLYDWALAEGLEPTLENGAELIIEAQLHRGANCIYHVMDSSDVARIMQHPFTMIASDGRITQYGQGHPHPRAYGTFPRVLGYYTREIGILSLEEAIRKMTSLPASTLGLNDRGILKEGAFADITIFDPNVIRDKATFDQPHQYPVGIFYVLINGIVTVFDGQFLDQRAGYVLKKEL